MSVTPLEAFQLYSGLKLHFNKLNYDFNKYGPNNKGFGADALMKKNNKYHYEKLAKKYHDAHELKDFLVAVFTDHKDTWVGDLFDGRDRFQKAHNRRIKVMSNLKYWTLEDAKKIAASPANDFCHLLMTRRINPETVCVLNRVTGFVDAINSDLNYKGELKFFWPEIQLNLVKVNGFVTVPSLEWLESLKQELKNEKVINV